MKRLGILYGSGYLGIALVTQVVMSWLVYFYAPPVERGVPVLLPLGLVGVAMLLGRFVDAIADPIVAIWSDRSQSPGGRRIPFLRGSLVPLALTFALLWAPPTGLATSGRFIFLLLMLALFFTFFTGYVAPYLALLPELAPVPTDRVRLSAWQAFFNIVGLAIAMVGSSIIIESHGFATMGIILGIIALISFLIPAAYVRETRTLSVDAAPTGGMWEHFALTWKNRSFVPFISSQILFWFGFNMVMVGIPYLVTVIMGGSEGDVGLVLAAAFVVALVCFPVVTRIANRHGLKFAQLLTMGWLVLVLFAWATIGYWPWGSPFAQGVIILATSGLALAGLFILPNALVAEITDRDFTSTGQRREAIYFGVQGLVLKAAMGLSSTVAAILLERYGYSSDAPWGVMVLGPIAAICIALGLWLFRTYPVSSSPASFKLHE